MTPGIERVGDAKPEWLTGLTHDPRDDAMVHRVAELLPAGYEAYLRLFHPFSVWGAAPGTTGGSQARTWRSLARDAGVDFNGELTWGSLRPALPIQEGKRPYEVQEGKLDPLVRRQMFSIIEEHTLGGPLYFFDGLAAVIAGRESGLFRASSGTPEEVLAVARSELAVESPELVWPEDRSWVVCTDYDLTSTYIASHRALAAALTSASQLEILEVSTRTRVSEARETFPNPRPG